MEAKPVPIRWTPELPIFASEPFLQTAGGGYGWLGGFDGAGKLRCVLPYTIVRRLFVRMIRFRTHTIPLGEELTLEEEKAFLNGVVEHFRRAGADMILPATNNTIFRACPDGAASAPYGSYVVDLEQDEATLWSNLHSKHRNVIRNAVKAGVQVRVGREYQETAFGLVRDTLKRSGMKFLSPAGCQRLAAALGDNLKTLVAEANGTVQGCAVLPFSRHSAHYLYGGSVPQPASGAMNLLHWEAFKLFRSLGVRYYDFVGVRINPEKGSKQEGLMRFKERFGGQLVQGCMWKYGFRKLSFLLYGLAVRLRQGGDVVDQERARHGIHQLSDVEAPPVRHGVGCQENPR